MYSHVGFKMLYLCKRMFSFVLCVYLQSRTILPPATTENSRPTELKVGLLPRRTDGAHPEVKGLVPVNQVHNMDQLTIWIMVTKSLDPHCWWVSQDLQPVSYKRYFRCNNCFLLLVYTIHISLSTNLVDPPPMGTIYMKHPLSSKTMALRF